MHLRITHEPWDASLPYVVEEIFDGATPYFRKRCVNEEDARRWAEGYLRGPAVIADLTNASEVLSESPTEHQ